MRSQDTFHVSAAYFFRQLADQTVQIGAVIKDHRMHAFSVTRIQCIFCLQKGFAQILHIIENFTDAGTDVILIFFLNGLNLDAALLSCLRQCPAIPQLLHKDDILIW